MSNLSVELRIPSQPHTPINLPVESTSTFKIFLYDVSKMTSNPEFKLKSSRYIYIVLELYMMKNSF